MSREAIRCIEGNLKRARLYEKADVLQMDYRNALMKWKSQNKKFDLVLLDPPYGKGLEFDALKLLIDGEMLEEDALVVVETALDHDGDEFEALGFEASKVKVYKTNKHYFLRKK
jgi:16S rRNA (guanine966-N2)-methyltransferase